MPIRSSPAAAIRGCLGRKVREGWPEVADFNDNVMKVGLAGETLAYRDQELTLASLRQARAGLDEFSTIRRCSTRPGSRPA